MAGTYELLDNIVTPTDLHKFSDKELKQVADEVRQAILDHVSKTGGHLSSNLGTVELTVAMYAAYTVPPDKVVWDTGHQAYPHKLLTGRLPRFDTLRKHKGISGFLRREEHELDLFGAGHAGTAISAALGFAAARDRLGTKEKVVAVTGDAAIASGMSWEALNHAGELQSDICVVLNDNRMSIAPNVGALPDSAHAPTFRAWHEPPSGSLRESLALRLASPPDSGTGSPTISPPKRRAPSSKKWASSTSAPSTDTTWPLCSTCSAKFESLITPSSSMP